MKREGSIFDKKRSYYTEEKYLSYILLYIVYYKLACVIFVHAFVSVLKAFSNNDQPSFINEEFCCVFASIDYQNA